MKALFKLYPIAVSGLITGLITGILAWIFTSGALALIVLLLQLTFGMCIEILLRVQVLRLHSSLGRENMEYLLLNSDAQRFVQAYVESARSVTAINQLMLTTVTNRWTERVESRLEEHRRGILSDHVGKEILSEVGPPGLLLWREPELLDSVNYRLCATSLVDVSGYWGSRFGKNYLYLQGELVQRLRPGWEPKDSSFNDLSDSPVTRIFVYPRDRLPELRDVLVAHKRYRLYARVAILEDGVPPDLCRDFMVVDDVLMEQLDLGPDGNPNKATFYFRDGAAGAEINQGLERFKKLGTWARVPEDFPEIGL